MQYDNNPNICSLMFLEDFGESIPMTNDPDTYYTVSDPTHRTFDEFIKALLKIADRDEIGDYDCALEDHSMIMAALVLPTEKVTNGQPTAIAHFRKLGFHEIVVEKYGKYRHGLIYFHCTGEELTELLKPYRK